MTLTSASPKNNFTNKIYCSQRLLGDLVQRDLPDPIPNSEVKALNTDDTCLFGDRESRFRRDTIANNIKKPRPFGLRFWFLLRLVLVIFILFQFRGQFGNLLFAGCLVVGAIELAQDGPLFVQPRPPVFVGIASIRSF